MERRQVLDSLLIAVVIVIGTGSILLFAAGESFHLVDLRLPTRDALLWDAGLSILFFVQHSGMVRRSFQARLSKAVAPRYHGAVYTIASGIVLTAVVLLWQPTAPPLLVLSGTAKAVAISAAAAAIAVFVWTAVAAGSSFDLLGIRPIRAHMRGRAPSPSRFFARGPYRWVRHPLYSCVLVLFWCAPAITADRLLLNVLWSAWIIAGAMLEERDLAADFGEVYREYQRRVPMLIPWRGAVRYDANAPAV